VTQNVSERCDYCGRIVSYTQDGEVPGTRCCLDCLIHIYGKLENDRFDRYFQNKQIHLLLSGERIVSGRSMRGHYTLPKKVLNTNSRTIAETILYLSEQIQNNYVFCVACGKPVPTADIFDTTDPDPICTSCVRHGNIPERTSNTHQEYAL